MFQIQVLAQSSVGFTLRPSLESAFLCPSSLYYSSLQSALHLRGFCVHSWLEAWKLWNPRTRRTDRTSFPVCAVEGIPKPLPPP